MSLLDIDGYYANHHGRIIPTLFVTVILFFWGG